MIVTVVPVKAAVKKNLRIRLGSHVTKKLEGLSATLEAYLENIQNLQRKYGAVRVTDLAQKMGCRMPTVTSALRRLSKLNLINYETYRPVTLTNSGETFVRKLSGKHRVLADFFKTILVLPDDIAESEACRLEHKTSGIILKRLGYFMEFVWSRSKAKRDMEAHQVAFQNFLNKNHPEEEEKPKTRTPPKKAGK